MDRFVFITDSHFNKKGFRTRTDDYCKALFKKLRWVLRYCKKRDIKHIIHGGDMLNSPNVSDWVTGKIAELFTQSGIQLLYCIGNHDITGKNPQTYIHSKLYMFESYDWFKFIGDNPVSFENTLVYGYDYIKDDEEETQYMIPREIYKVNQDKVKIIVVHQMIVGQRESLVIRGRKRMISYRDISTNADIVLSGHYHPGMKTKKVTELEHTTYFANPGSFARTDTHTAEVSHGPGLIDISIDEGHRITLKHVIIPHAENVFVDKPEGSYYDRLVNNDKFIDTLNEFKKRGVASDNVQNMLLGMLEHEGLPFEYDEELMNFILEKVKEVSDE